jgi:hypothetical protein
MAAIHRHAARQTLLQMTSLRIAAWGNDEAVERFRAALSGDAKSGDETDAALAAFGVSREA